MVRSLGDYDFFGGAPKPEDRIKIRGLLTGFEKNNPDKYPNWFNTLSGGTPLWFNPSTNEVCDEEKDGFQLAVEIGFCARFDEEDLEFEFVRYFIDADTDPFEDNTVKLNSNHLKEIGFFLLPSKRNWERTISFGSDLFKKVIKFQDAIPGKAVLKTRDSLRGIKERIEQDEPLKSIVDRINSEITGFIGDKAKGLNFIPTTGDIEGVLQSLTPHLNGYGDTNIPLGNHGSGLVSLQTLLLLLEFGRHRHEKEENFILGAEEPELHLQPGIHRRLVGRIRGLSNQSIVTTHSPQIASYYKPSEISIVQNADGNMKLKTLLKPVEEIPQKNAVMRLYTLYRAEICEALMNRRIILPEGLTEFNWFKAFIGVLVTAEGWEAKDNSKYTVDIGILPTQSASVLETFKTFSPLVDELIPFVDGDDAGDGYVKELKKYNNPPKTILQLPKDWNMERLLGWILSTDGKVSQKFGEVLGIESEIGQALAPVLDRFKPKWDTHGKIIEFISDQAECLDRLRYLMASLSLLHLTLKEKEADVEAWKKDEIRSVDPCDVYVFNPSKSA